MTTIQNIIDQNTSREAQKILRGIIISESDAAVGGGDEIDCCLLYTSDAADE